MIDDKDISESTLRLIVWNALAGYSTSELLALLTDEDYIVRTSAAKQLHFRPTQEVVDHLKRLLSDERDCVREIAAFGLGQLGTPEKPFKGVAHEWLKELLSADPSSDVRAAAAAALGHLFIDESLPGIVEEALAAAASDPHAEVRACVAFALSSHRESLHAARILQQLAGDSDPRVRTWACDDDDSGDTAK